MKSCLGNLHISSSDYFWQDPVLTGCYIIIYCEKSFRKSYPDFTQCFFKLRTFLYTHVYFPIDPNAFVHTHIEVVILCCSVNLVPFHFFAMFNVSDQ